jgi:hypothetical protein
VQRRALGLLFAALAAVLAATAAAALGHGARGWIVAVAALAVAAWLASLAYGAFRRGR